MRKIILLFAFFAIVISANAQYEKMKAIFIYNFTRYIEWPANYKAGDFVIGVLGPSSITSELKSIAKMRKVGRQDITIKSYSSINQVMKCHILFIPTPQSKHLPAAVNKMSNKSILLIGDGKGLASKGAAISFFMKGSSLSFEVNQATLKKHKLNVNKDLFALGVLVQ